MALQDYTARLYKRSLMEARLARLRAMQEEIAALEKEIDSFVADAGGNAHRSASVGSVACFIRLCHLNSIATTHWQTSVTTQSAPATCKVKSNTT